MSLELKRKQWKGVCILSLSDYANLMRSHTHLKINHLFFALHNEKAVEAECPSRFLLSLI